MEMYWYFREQRYICSSTALQYLEEFYREAAAWQQTFAMTKGKAVRRIVILLLLSAAAIFLCYRSTGPDMADPRRVLEASLEKDEVMIDTAVDDSTAYAITSKTGSMGYGDTLMVFYRNGEEGWECVYENDFEDLKPWKIELADIDGDGEKELVTAVCKTVRFDKTKKNRLFVFNYTNGMLVKKWTGSQIAGDWEDFTTGDFAPVPGDEIAFIRRTEAGERVSMYYWYDFGFLMLMESNDYEDITAISIPEEGRICMVYKTNGKERTAILAACSKKLTEAIE